LSSHHNYMIHLMT